MIEATYKTWLRATFYNSSIQGKRQSHHSSLILSALGHLYLLLLSMTQPLSVCESSRLAESDMGGDSMYLSICWCSRYKAERAGRRMQSTRTNKKEKTANYRRWLHHPATHTLTRFVLFSQTTTPHQELHRLACSLECIYKFLLLCLIAFPPFYRDR